MARRSGYADLPLHGGRAPKWLFERMALLAPAIVEAIVLERGPAEVLRRLSDPFWFQAFGCVLGFDWHSSGVTTVVCGALKEGLKGREADTGLWVAGGKGRASKRTPRELVEHGLRTGLDGDRLAYTSRLTAKVDSAAVQDGFQIYHHTFLHTTAGEWAVVQQGMRAGDTAARRYHWLGEQVHDLVDEPHAAIASSAPADAVLDLVAHESASARGTIAEIARSDPDRLAREAARVGAALGDAPARRQFPAEQLALFDGHGDAGTRGHADGAATEADAHDVRVVLPRASVSPRPSASGCALDTAPPSVLRMPPGHAVDVRRDLDPALVHKVLLRTYEAAPADFEALLALPGVGARSVRALALIAELVYGRPASARDPARFSFAHGGKDGHPYPVDRATYDRSVAWLREGVERARVGRSEKLQALKRLDRWGGGEA